MEGKATLIESEMCAIMEDGINDDAIAYFIDKWMKSGNLTYIAMLTDLIEIDKWDKKSAICMTISRYFSREISKNVVETISNN